jgi:drug/metabolite transporter (DMT)-like permease
MKIEFLFFIVLSAFLHAFYNFLMRRSGGKRVFLMGLFVVAGLISVVTTISAGSYSEIPWAFVPVVCGAGLFYIMYQVFVSKAYERGDISRLYPLTVLSPIFIPFWAAFFLGERISVITGAGIVVAIIGAALVKLNEFSAQEFKKMLRFSKGGGRNGEYRGARLALVASLLYSFGAVLDKSKIASFPLSAYLLVLLWAMSFYGYLYVRFVDKERLMPYFRAHWKTVVLGGVVLFFSFYTFRIALKMVPVSIAVPVRLVSIVFAIFLGVVALKEKPRPWNLIGSVIVILGIVLVNAGL